MGFVPELDEQRKAATREKILETALRVFAEKTIDAVNLTDIAKEAGIGMATVYRHFDKKPDLVLAASTWAWQKYRQENWRAVDRAGMSAAEVFEYFLDAFLDLYRNHRDLLRFNQYFNAYVKREGIPPERMKPYADVMNALAAQFHTIWTMGEQDGTLRTDVPEGTDPCHDGLTPVSPALEAAPETGGLDLRFSGNEIVKGFVWGEILNRKRA